MASMETETKLYEIGYLLRSDLENEGALRASESVRKIIEDEKGLIIQEIQPQRRNLAYPLKKLDAAYFGSFKFIFPFEKIANLKKSLEKTDLLRLLLTQVKQQKETAKIFPKRRSIRRVSQKESSLSEGEPGKKPPAPEPLQVEEIDKKLEEILGQ